MTRIASAVDAGHAAALLHAFAAEFGDPTPGAEVLAQRLGPAIEAGDVLVLLSGDPAVGIAHLTFRPSIWTGAPAAFLEDLYVLAGERGHGHGRALLAAAMDDARDRGAATFELYTGENDKAARHLYEALGMSNTEPGETDALLYYHRRL